MPKFKFLKQGTNEDILNKATANVEKYLDKILKPGELIKVDDIYSFKFGTIMVQVRVKAFHSEDVLVNVFSYLAEDIEYNSDLGEKLLRLNATIHFGSFGITYDNSVIYSYSLAGANLDYNEFLAALQAVATISDSYDEIVQEMVG